MPCAPGLPGWEFGRSPPACSFCGPPFCMRCSANCGVIRCSTEYWRRSLPANSWRFSRKAPALPRCRRRRGRRRMAGYARLPDDMQLAFASAPAKTPISPAGAAGLPGGGTRRRRGNCNRGCSSEMPLSMPTGLCKRGYGVLSRTLRVENTREKRFVDHNYAKPGEVSPVVE